jgi:hypothetical protein
MNESNVNDGPHGEPPSESPDKVPVLVLNAQNSFSSSPMLIVLTIRTTVL